jgi:Cu+-exporting ATPase
MLRDKPGIHSIKVALLAERAVILYDPSKWTIDALVNEVSDIGFDAFPIPTSQNAAVSLKIYGMTCSACTSTVETQLGAMPGIHSVAVSLATETASVSYDRTLIGPREMVERIEELGFDAMLAADESDLTQKLSLQRTKEIQEWRTRFRISLSFAVPVFFISMVFPMIPLTRPIVNFKLFRGFFLGDVLALILTIPVQFWLGKRFYISAWKAIKHKSATMDVLVVLGTSAAFFYSVFTMLFTFLFSSDPDFHPSVFFDTSSMLIMFVSLGKFLENVAKGRTSAALTDLMSLSPSMATIYTDPPACTQEKKVATELVQAGDIVKIVPGDRIPADGIVLRGSSSVDESPVTGEATPVLKQSGDALIGGTINGLGSFDMTVTRAGRDSALAQIVKLVEEAQTNKAPIQAFADKVAGYFVPAVISLALITFVGWMLFSYFCVDEDALPDIFRHKSMSKLAVCLNLCISVVVVACPCALGLATPTAIMVGTGIGAQNGILIKGGRALESVRLVKKIVLDKTGTVTVGKMGVSAAHWPDTEEEKHVDLNTASAEANFTKAEVLEFVKAAEARSEHPLAKAVGTYAMDILNKAGVLAIGDADTAENFESVTGAGVQADLVLSSKKRGTVFIGTSSFVYPDRTLPASFLQFEQQEEEQGRTVIFVSVRAQSLTTSSSSTRPTPVLALSLSDALKPSSIHAIKELKRSGMEIYMMTGDAEGTAKAIARLAGIKEGNVWSRMSPQGKARAVTELLEKGDGVAMVSFFRMHQ